jgi:hypothetical protein
VLLVVAEQELGVVEEWDEHEMQSTRFEVVAEQLESMDESTEDKRST